MYHLYDDFRRGAIVTTFIVCYAFTSFISGYVSGGMYSRNGGMHFLCLFMLLFNLLLRNSFELVRINFGESMSFISLLQANTGSSL